MDNRNTNHNPNAHDAAGKQAARNTDLPDSPHDAERLKPEETIIELPDVKDIPGQEFVHVPPLGM